MIFRWFTLAELGTHPDAPQEGDLVWLWISRTGRMADPMTLDHWNSEQCRAGIAKHYGEEFAAAQQYQGWRVVEQANKIEIDPGDLVCRVLKPEEPQL